MSGGKAEREALGPDNGEQIERDKTAEPRTSKLKDFLGFVRFLLLLSLFLLVAGFAVFINNIKNAQAPDPLPRADGIVVLTGDGGRIAQAGKLLAEGMGERLLVTGVARSVSNEDLEKLLGVDQETLSCCIDIDVAAQDTVGNARETAVWAAALGYEHIILVTSDYHMARAKMEITTATKGIRITPFPVSSRGMDMPLLEDGGRLKRIWLEYIKLLVISLRETGARPELPPRPFPDPEQIMRDRQAPPTIIGPQGITAEGSSEEIALEEITQEDIGE